MVFDQAGAIYGTTEAGGAFNAGVVYKLTRPDNGAGAWTQTVLYTFTGSGDGLFFQTGLVFDRSGALYGTTAFGGIFNSSCGGGCGVIFKLVPPLMPGGAWTEETLYRFTGGADGTFPGGLVFGPHGALYGMTNLGGANGLGAVFQLSSIRKQSAWEQTVLYSFETGDRFAGYPQAPVVIDRAGALYGMRKTGGDLNLGIVFKLNPPTVKGGPWTAEILHSFGSAGDGLGPIGRVTLDRTGAVYGTTGAGGTGRGVIFKLTPPAGSGLWSETILHTFNGVDGGSARLNSPN